MGEKTLGQIAFEAYSEERGGKNHDGTETPSWEELGDDVHCGWEMAALEVAKTWAVRMHQVGHEAWQREYDAVRLGD